LDFKIDKILPHPGYSIAEKSNDIEIIRIKGNIPFDTPFVRPICLPFEEEYGIKGMVKPKADDFVSRTGVVAGWGRTQWSTKLANYGIQKHISAISCKSVFSFT
jgi:predicted transcriptional regulator